MYVTIVLALVAATLVCAGGYLLGVRRGTSARDSLRKHLTTRHDELQGARAEAVALRTELQVARMEAQDVRGELTRAQAGHQAAEREASRMRGESQANRGEASELRGEADHFRGLAVTARAEADQLRQQVQGMGAETEQLRAQVDTLRTELASRPRADRDPQLIKAQIDDTLRTLMGPLLQREADARGLREQVQGLLGPMVERERLGLEFARLNREATTRGDLPHLLSMIAQRGGFSTVLLSDAEGLTLASNSGTENPEVLSATTSLLLTLADRIAQGGDPPPIAAALRDEDNRVVLHRIFRVREERYVLTAVNKGLFLPPDVLDPTLVQLERLLADHALS